MKSYNKPNAQGYFGEYGGKFAPETLMPQIAEIETNFARAKSDPEFLKQLLDYNKFYTGRPSPLYYAENLTKHLGGAKVYFKRDELNHTGSHKINNAIGQGLLAQYMGKTRIIAETGAGQHGVATATICAKLGMQAVVYMGAKDYERQKPNVFRMRLLGATVVKVETGSRTLKSAMNEAMRDWVANVHDSYYLIGTVAGPHPYPEMVRHFQSIIGIEAKQQILELENQLPAAVMAVIGGGSNAIGLFHAFIDESDVQLIGVESEGKGFETGEHAAALCKGESGVLHGNKSYYLQNDDGQIMETYSISAGLDYPGVGPEHSYLKDIKRAEYVAVTDIEALEAFQLLCKLEGIIPALEPSHAIAHLIKIAKQYNKSESIIVNLCGRGDKDIFTVAKHLNIEIL
ncbi:MAG: tryptophan synthase subunit beta [Rickettsiales bacterium]|jgi:tryptophan synthase beta chain|nr:tryptophan synthase subunit beta [Rickettsiales bacterium]